MIVWSRHSANTRLRSIGSGARGSGDGLQPAATTPLWSDDVEHVIHRLRIGDDSPTNFALGIPYVDAMAIDLVGEHVYWTFHESDDSAGIARARFDGTDVNAIVLGLRLPTSVAIVEDVIHSFRLDGSDVRVLCLASCTTIPGGSAFRMPMVDCIGLSGLRRARAPEACAVQSRMALTSAKSPTTRRTLLGSRSCSGGITCPSPQPIRTSPAVS